MFSRTCQLWCYQVLVFYFWTSSSLFSLALLLYWNLWFKNWGVLTWFCLHQSIFRCNFYQGLTLAFTFRLTFLNFNRLLTLSVYIFFTVSCVKDIKWIEIVKVKRNKLLLGHSLTNWYTAKLLKQMFSGQTDFSFWRYFEGYWG